MENEDDKTITQELSTSIETRVPFEHLQEFPTDQCSISIKEQEQNENNGMNSIVEVATKLRKTGEIVEQMQQQLLNKGDSYDLDNNKERQKIHFEEHAISLLENLLESKKSTPDSEDEMIVVNHTDNDETRESSALSDSLIIGQMSYEEFDNALKPPFKRHFTFDPDIPGPLLKREISQYDSVQSHTSNNMKDHSNLHLDEITAENIRLKMLASSLSEAEPNILKDDMWNQMNSHNRGTKLMSSNISTTLTDTIGTSTDTDTTIIVDAAKSPKENEVREIATALPDKVGNHEMDQDEAAARRMAFQRGNALQNESIPDENQFFYSEDEQPNICKQTTELYSNEYILKWLSRRQNSMPVQIDSEIFRVIPKHMRKRIKSAEGCKTQNQAFQD